MRLSDGENIRTERVGGNFSGSPICVDGKLNCVSEAGVVHVLAAAPRFEVLGKTELNDPSRATPGVANGRRFRRTFIGS